MRYQGQNRRNWSSQLNKFWTPRSLTTWPVILRTQRVTTWSEISLDYRSPTSSSMDAVKVVSAILNWKSWVSDRGSKARFTNRNAFCPATSEMTPLLTHHQSARMTSQTECSLSWTEVLFHETLTWLQLLNVEMRLLLTRPCWSKTAALRGLLSFLKKSQTQWAEESSFCCKPGNSKLKKKENKRVVALPSWPRVGLTM